MDSLKTTDEAAAAVQQVGHPRVSLADIEANIAAEYTFTGDTVAEAMGSPVHPSLSVLTICVLVLCNGFTIIGKSAPADAANFNAELGRKFAREDAIRQCWPLMGYALREKLAAL